MSRIKIRVTDVLANLHRDMNVFKLNEGKVTSLVESIEQTTFWENLITRAKGNMINGKLATQETIDANVDADGYWIGQVELGYGHHRLEALRRCNIEYVELPVKVITDGMMLRIMANENKEGYGSSPVVMMETVSKVDDEMSNLLDGVDEYDEYIKQGILMYMGADKDGNDVSKPLFGTAQAFGNAKGAGIGAVSIQRFLGSTWNLTTIKRAKKALDFVKAGLYRQVDIEGILSLGLLNELSRVLDFMRNGGVKETKGEDGAIVKGIIPAPAWPDHFKNEISISMISQCTPDENGKVVMTTAKLSNSLSRMKNKGARPDTTGSKAFSWKTDLFEMATEGDHDVTKALEVVGNYLGFEGITKTDIEEVEAKVKAHYEAKAKEPADGKVEGTELTEGESGELQDSVDGAIAGAEAGAKTEAGESGNLLENFDALEDAPIEQLIGEYSGLVAQVAQISTKFAGKVGAMEVVPEAAVGAVRDILDVAVRTACEVLDPQQTRAALKAILKSIEV